MIRAAVAQPQTLSGAHPRRRLYRQPPVAHPRRDPRAVQGLKRRQHQNRRGLGQGAPDGYAWLDLRRLQQSIGLDHLAEALGVAAGPIRTTAAKSIPGFEQFEETWNNRAPLGWDVSDAVPAARACAALLSDWFPATTGEIVHVDGGVHAMGQ